MPNLNKTLVDMETRFWQSLVDNDTNAALEVLNEPALMVSAHGAMQFDHDGYRKMADQGSLVLTSFKLNDMKVVFPNDATAILTYRVKQEMAPRGKSKTLKQEMNDTSTWIQTDAGWKCVMHTETPVDAKRATH